MQNARLIDEMRTRISTIENIGSGTNTYTQEIDTLKKIIQQQADSIAYLNKLLANSVSKTNSKSAK